MRWVAGEYPWMDRKSARQSKNERAIGSRCALKDEDETLNGALEELVDDGVSSEEAQRRQVVGS